MDRRIVVFDQEIYNQFQYKCPRSYFHTFEADNGQVGLNFADETEASNFRKRVEDKLTERRLRRERRNATKRQKSVDSPSMTLNRQPSDYNHTTNGGSVQRQSVGPPLPPPNPNNTQQIPAHIYYKQQQHGPNSGGKGKGEKRGKLRKSDISLPTNFQHVSHVGWDPNRGFDLENVDPKLQQFFSKAGVSEKELADKETREFIYDFIDKHGGVEAALKEVERKQSEAASQPTNGINNQVRQQGNYQLQEQIQNAPAPPPRQSSMSRPPPPSQVQASPPTRPPPTYESSRNVIKQEASYHMPSPRRQVSIASLGPAGFSSSSLRS